MRALVGVLPRAAESDLRIADRGVGLVVGGRELEVRWVGEGNLGDVKAIVENRGPRPDILVARHFSPGARARMSEEDIGWVDETGAAEIAFGSVIISRTGTPPAPRDRSLRWTPAVLGVAEALLCGTKPTVAEIQMATGLSTGSSVNALRVLTDVGLLEADAARGRGSGRRVGNRDDLLDAYALEASAMPASLSVAVGTVWRDPLAGLVEVGRLWDQSALRWAATGLAATAVMAPFVTTVSTTEVYVDSYTVVGLESAALDAGLRPIEGGRLTLKPFPTVATRQLAHQIDGLRVAPWPRVFVDLRKAGVRGEEAAEHLREVMHDG